MNIKSVVLLIFLSIVTFTLRGQINIKSDGYTSMANHLKAECDKFTEKNPDHIIVGSIQFSGPNEIGPSDFLTVSTDSTVGKNDIYEMIHFESDSTGAEWRGVSQDKSATVTLFFNDYGYYGAISRDNYQEVFRVLPIDGTTSIVIKDDRVPTEEEWVCGIQSTSECIPNLEVCGTDPFDNSDCEGNCPAHIEFLFLVSDEGYDYYGSNEMTAVNIRLMISDLETAWRNSNISNSASYEWVRYDYSVPTEGDCVTIAMDLACQHEDIHDLRMQYGADIVVLLSTPGITWPNAQACVPVIGALPEAGYIVQPVHTALNNNTFPHEVGHVFGCQHTFGPDTRNCCGLGTRIVADGGTKRTIMFGQSDIPYYSDPKVEYMGVPTGLDNESNGRMYNSAGKIRTTSCIVGDFVESVTPQVSILFEQINCEIVSTSLYNNVVLDDDNYSFAWYLTEDGDFSEDDINQYTSLGTGESVIITDTEVGDPCENYFVHLAVLKFGQIIFHRSRVIRGGICTDNPWCGPLVTDKALQDSTNDKGNQPKPRVTRVDYYDIFGNFLFKTYDTDLSTNINTLSMFQGIVVKVIYYDDGTRDVEKLFSHN